MMKKTKKGFKSLAILLALVLAIGFSPATNVSAKTAPRLNYKKVTIVQGKKKRLKVKGTKRKVKWSSTKKSVVTVNKKGVIKAKKKGKATIIAKVGKKKLRCKVTVKKKPAKKSSKKSGKKSTSSERKQLSYYAGALSFPGALKVGENVDLINYNSDYSINKKYKISNSVRAKYFKWYVKDKTILTVNKYGIATGKKVGTTKVSCRYMTEDGTWRTTKTVTAKVIAASNFKLSYSISLDSEKAQNAKYRIWNTEKKKLFNTITVNITNTSNTAVTLSDVVEFRIGSNSFVFSNAGDVQVNSGESKTITYQSSYFYDAVYAKCYENYILDYEDVGSVWFTYFLGNKKAYYVHHIEKYAHSPRDDYWEYR